MARPAAESSEPVRGAKRTPFGKSEANARRPPGFRRPSAAARYLSRMGRRNHPKRRIDAYVLLAPIASCALAAFAASPDPGEQCIVGDHAIGCTSERAIVELTMPRKDAGALQQLVRDKLASGQCRLFDYGERVQVTSTEGSERTQVHVSGDHAAYWIPASWSRPAAECDGTRSAAALHRKLGVADALAQASDAGERGPSFDDGRASAFSDTRVRSFADERVASQRRWDDDDGGDDDERFVDDRARRPPPLPPRALPSSRYAHDCAFKSVMTDADLVACRNVRR